jgi:hypothetical protein
MQNVIVRIRNSGNSAITSANVSYQINGATPVTLPWTGTLLPCDSQSIVFSGLNQFNFQLGTSYTIKAFVSSPNGTTDPVNTNDTITNSGLCVGMSGTFTINASGSGSTNFTSFNAAYSALTCGGLTGPVTFNVANGIYNEQLTL